MVEKKQRELEKTGERNKQELIKRRKRGRWERNWTKKLKKGQRRRNTTEAEKVR